MNIAKNMEAIFVVAAVLLGASAYTSAAAQTSLAVQPVRAAATAATTSMQVVVITGKRLTAAEKASLAN